MEYFREFNPGNIDLSEIAGNLTWGIQKVQAAAHPDPLQVPGDTGSGSGIAGTSLDEAIDECTLAHIGEAYYTGPDCPWLQAPGCPLRIDGTAHLGCCLGQLQSHFHLIVCDNQARAIKPLVAYHIIIALE